MFRSLVVFAALAISSAAALNLGVVAGFPAPDLSNVKLTQRDPAAAAGPYIAGFPVPQV